MTSVGIGVLITSIGDEINIFLPARHIWSQNLPIIAAVLKSDFALEGLDKVLSNG